MRIASHRLQPRLSFLIRVDPLVRRNLPLLGQLDHANRWLVPARADGATRMAVHNSVSITATKQSIGDSLVGNEAIYRKNTEVVQPPLGIPASVRLSS
jgi:hypothetical protein